MRSERREPVAGAEAHRVGYPGGAKLGAAARHPERGHGAAQRQRLASTQIVLWLMSLGSIMNVARTVVDRWCSRGITLVRSEWSPCPQRNTLIIRLPVDSAGVAPGP